MAKKKPRNRQADERELSREEEFDQVDDELTDEPGEPDFDDDGDGGPEPDVPAAPGETSGGAAGVSGVSGGEATDLPPDFPCRDKLLAAGYRTVAQVKTIGDLTAIPGIRAIHIDAIRAASGWKRR